MEELEKYYNYREIIKLVKEEEDLEQINVDKEEKVEDDNAQESKDEVSNQKKNQKKNKKKNKKEENENEKEEKVVVVENKNKKYVFPVKFAGLWFKTLAKILLKHKLDDFLADIAGYTLVGEHVGDIDNQHIQLYKEHEIIFFAMVKNNSKDICNNFEDTYNVFKKYGLRFCEYNKFGPADSEEKVYKILDDIYIDVLESNITKNGEGSVLYLSELDKSSNKDKIISMCKVKTIEYRISRKIRDTLKRVAKDEGLKDKIIKKLIKETKELLGEEVFNLDVECYYDFAKYCFENHRSFSNQYNIFTKYANFLCQIIPEYESKTKKKLEIKILNKHESLKMIEKSIEPELKKNEPKKIDAREMNIIIVVGLVGCGKSTMYKIMEQLIKSEFPDLNIFYVSSDEIREKLTLKEIANSKKKLTFEEAFNKTAKSTRTQFLINIETSMIKEYKNDKTNFLFFDKNVPPDQLEKTSEELLGSCEKAKLKCKIHFFYPNNQNSITLNNLYYPFSWAYFIQCYFRIKNRKHFNLDSEKKRRIFIKYYFSFWDSINTLNIAK